MPTALKYLSASSSLARDAARLPCWVRLQRVCLITWAPLYLVVVVHDTCVLLTCLQRSSHMESWDPEEGLHACSSVSKLNDGLHSSP